MGHVDPVEPENNAPPNLFVAMTSPGQQGFQSGNNLYCLEPSAGASFYLGGAGWVDHAGWIAGVMTDETSSVEPRAGASCSAL